MSKSKRTEAQMIAALKQVERGALSKSAVYAQIREGSFPKSLSLGGTSVAWIECEVRDWMQACIAVSRSSVNNVHLASAPSSRQLRPRQWFSIIQAVDAIIGAARGAWTYASSTIRVGIGGIARRDQQPREGCQRERGVVAAAGTGRILWFGLQVLPPYKWGDSSLSSDWCLPHP